MGEEVEFRLFGPVEVWLGDRLMDAGRPRQRAVLAVLLVEAGRAVTIETLVDRVWGETPPDAARHALHTDLGRIRRLLAEVGEPGALVRRHGGYLLDIAPDTVDLHRFRRLVDRARDPRVADAERADLLGEALGRWRGEPLVGLSGPWPERVRETYRALRLEAAVRWAEIRLRLGDPGAVIEPMAGLAADHPLAEPVVAVLMRALHAAGRTAEALGHYTTIRKRLVEDLGAEPGAELQRVHREILRGEADRPPAPADRPRFTVPAQLPPAVPGFAGRGAELARLDAVLAGIDRRPGAVMICAVSGTAGVGKTALAVHWAHRVSERFPDGQLYVNLRGFDPAGPAVAPEAALRGFLEALGVAPQRVPASPATQMGLYRSLLAGRRVLVLLDNARDADQVRPLLPGSPTALVLVTSRDQLAGLVAAEGAYPVTVPLLSTVEADELLARRLGGDRVAAEPQAVGEIMAACARLPLALAIVAARAVTRPDFPLRVLAGELRAARTGLDAFAGGDPATDVRAVFSWSCAALGPPAARLYRLLGLHPGPDVTGPAAASLAGLEPVLARRLLAELTRAHLLVEHLPGRYAVHDLLHAYAAELVREQEPDADRHAARRRLLDHYLHTALAGARLLDPHRDPIPLDPPAPGVEPEPMADADTALAWFTAEHAILMALVRDADSDTHAWQLAWTLVDYLDRQGHWENWAATQTAAVAAARRLADAPAEAQARRSLGRAYTRLRRYDEASGQLRQALELYRGSGNRVGEARARFDLGLVGELQGDRRAAVDHVERAYQLYRLAGHEAGQAQALNALGWIQLQNGDYERALDACRRALGLLARIGDRRNEAATWDTIGSVHHVRGDHPEAVDCYRRAIELFEDIGDRYYEADTLVHLGETRRSAGDLAAARTAWQRALAILVDLGHPDADQVRQRLA